MVFELLAEGVLDAPEATGGDGAFLRGGGHVGGGGGGLGGGVGVQGHFGGGEGAEEAGEEGGHVGGHCCDAEGKECEGEEGLR